ncbi:MAG: flavin reductase family protein [Elusimicrobiaceae bacterium]|nr:flavin reductase family protein [Elusimicrobiaceae bacterium]
MRKGKLEKAFTYLESGSVLLVTSHDKKDNVMTISWQMVLDFTPRIAICTGPWNDSFNAIIRSKQCVLCVPTVDMLDKVVGIGTVHSSERDKFKFFRLKKQEPAKVKAPLIADCLAAIECNVIDYVKKYGILVLDGIQLWENPLKKERRVIHANGDGTFFADGDFFNCRKKMESRLSKGVKRF